MKYLITAVGLFASLAIACTSPGTNNAPNSTRANATPAAPTTPAPAATVDTLASGRKLYEANCAACHKDDGSGGPMEIEGKKIDADDLTSDKIKKFTDEKILGYIMNGVPDEGMPAFKGKLSEGEMRDIVEYVRKEIQKTSGGSELSAPKS